MPTVLAAPDNMQLLFDIPFIVSIEAAGEQPTRKRRKLKTSKVSKGAKGRSERGDRKASLARATDERTSIFDFYLADLERYPLLTREEERELGEIVVDLGKRVVRVEEMRGKPPRPVKVSRAIVDLTGDQLAELMNRLEADAENASPSERELLAHLIRREEAVQKLTVHNLRFGINKAKKYTGLGVPLDDLVSGANEGLMHAARKFDPAQGRFSTYAGWWVQQYLLKMLAEQGRLFRVPTWIQSDVRKLARVHLAMSEALGRQPTPEELAAEMGLKPKKVAALLVFLSPSVSLNGSGKGSESADETNLGERINGTNDLAADHSASTRCEEHDAREALTRVLSQLDDQEREIVRCYYGIETGEMMTFHQIGRRVGLGRERVRQICRAAVAKLRVDSRTEILRDFWVEMGG